MGTPGNSEVRVLLVDDDREEYVVTKKYLRDARTGTFQLEWVPSFGDALRAMKDTHYDVCLLDYDLGERTGIELLNEMRSLRYDLPVILLTGRGSLELDLEAMQMGAFDYLEKSDVTPVLLERSIRYTIENHRARAALREANEELEQRVRERTAELHRSNQDLEQFANVVARDLREPLRAITRHIEQMKARQTGHEPREAAPFTHALLGPLLRAARNMELLVQSALDYSRAGREAKPFEVVDLSVVLRDVCAELADTIHAVGAAVDVGPMPSVQGDANLVKGLFENLLDNALKFRGEEPPQIRVWSERKGANWLCAVRDNGMGISDENIEDIFLMFHRGGQEPARPGIGIGLGLCQKIVQYHGGMIWVDSEPGRGSTFYLTFPAE